LSLPIDDSAFKTVYFDHHQKAYRVAYYILKNEQAAEDLVQEVFLKLWEKGDGLEQISNLEAYVHQMVKNAAFTLIKSTPNYQSEMMNWHTNSHHMKRIMD
jgi:RNA polymerase sigma-70 factor (ECF subfamily)